MKKKLLALLLVLTILFTFAACNIGSNNGNTDNNSSNISKDDEQNGGGSDNNGELNLDGIPQEWIDLFAFNNVTIFLKNNLTIKRGNEYRCVNGNWYAKFQGFEEFENHNGRYIYDLYLTNYSIFTYDEGNSYYKASNVALDDSGYLHAISIAVVEGKITNITDTATLNSSTIVTTLGFYNYGTTQME